MSKNETIYEVGIAWISRDIIMREAKVERRAKTFKVLSRDSGMGGSGASDTVFGYNTILPIDDCDTSPSDAIESFVKAKEKDLAELRKTIPVIERQIAEAKKLVADD